MMNYELRGREIYSEKGRLVATLDGDGNPVMAPGMSGPHSKGVREFIASRMCNPSPEPHPEPPEPSEEQPELAPEQSEEPTPETPELPEPTENPPEQMSTVFVGSIAAKPSGVSEKVPVVLSRSEWEISTIPADQLPPFDPALGIYTPGFSEYVKRFNLNAPQIAALIKRVKKGRRYGK